MATEARARAILPEQLLIVLKDVWSSLPEVRSMTEHARAGQPAAARRDDVHQGVLQRLTVRGASRSAILPRPLAATMLDRASARLAAIPTCSPAAHPHRAVSARRRRRRGRARRSPRIRASTRWRAASSPARASDQLRHAARPSGNFEIFRTASRHLLSGQDLYAEYPAEHTDRFKYSPTFALLFAPFAWLPWPLALLPLERAQRDSLLFVAVERVLPARRALLAQACSCSRCCAGCRTRRATRSSPRSSSSPSSRMERQRMLARGARRRARRVREDLPARRAHLRHPAPARDPHRASPPPPSARRSSRCRCSSLSPADARSRSTSRGAASRARDAQQRWFSVMELLHRITGVDAARTGRSSSPERCAARAARAPARPMGRCALPAALSLLRAALRRAVQPSGGARELPHRVHGRDDLVRVRARRALAHVALRHRPFSPSRSCPRSFPARGCARRRR